MHGDFLTTVRVYVYRLSQHFDSPPPAFRCPPTARSAWRIAWPRYSARRPGATPAPGLSVRWLLSNGSGGTATSLASTRLARDGGGACRRPSWPISRGG